MLSRKIENGIDYTKDKIKGPGKNIDIYSEQGYDQYLRRDTSRFANSNLENKRIPVESIINFNDQVNNVPEGENLYFTTERSQDATIDLLTDSEDIDFVYSEPDNQLKANLTETGATAGEYDFAKVTIDDKGRVTAIEANILSASAIVAVSDTTSIDLTNTAGTLTADVIPGGIAHNDLASKQGGTAGEYYHLTSAQNTLVGGITASAAELNILDGATLSTTELNYVDGVTSAIQTQLDNKQPLDATLTALAAYNTNGLLTQTAADTFTGRTITGTTDQITVSNGDGVSGNPTLSLPADVIIPTVITTPNTGLHILDTDASHDLIIKPGSNLTADKTFTLTTGDNDRTLNISAANVTFTSYGASLVAAANDVAAQILLSLVPGSNVQAWDAALDDFAGLTQAADKLPYFDSATTMATTDLTAFGRSLIDDVDAATARTTLGLVAGGAGDIWVEKAGDTMTGTLTVDINADNSAINIVQNATQTTHPIQLRNSADSAYTSAIDANGRFRSVASTSSGIAWMDGTLASTTYLTLNHTSTSGTLTNGTGDFNLNGASGQTVYINSTGIDINTIIRSADDDNMLNIDGGLNAIGIGDSPASAKRVTMSQSWSTTGNPTTLIVNGTQTAAAATTLKGATFNVFMTHTSGSLSGANVTEFNWTASGNGGTTSTVEGLNFIGTVGTGATVTTANYIHLYAPNVTGTLGTLNALKIDAGNVIFNDGAGNYDFRVEGQTNVNLLFVDASADTVQINSATTADSAKFYVDGKISTSGELEVNGDLNHDGSNIGFFGVAPAARASAYTVTNGSTDRAYDANATSIDELADVLGTLITDLKSYGLLQ